MSMSAKNTTVEKKTPTKTVADFDTKDVRYEDLDRAPIDLLIKTYKRALETKVSPILDISTRSYAQKAPKGGKGKTKNSGKVYEITFAILCTDGKLYKDGGQGEDNEMGPAGIQGGVKAPQFRTYGSSIMFKTKTNKKLGLQLSLMCQVLVMDAEEKIKNGTIKVKNKSVTNPVKDEIGAENDKIDATTKKEYHEAGDYMIRMNIVTRGPEKTRLFEEKIVEEQVDEDDIPIPDSTKFLHTNQIELTEKNVHEKFTLGMGMEYFEYGVTRKHHGFGVSFNIFLSSCYPIPRSVSYDKPKPKTNRSLERRLKFAEKAAERAKIAQQNAESIKQRNEKNDDGDEDEVEKKHGKKNSGKKGRNSFPGKAPPPSDDDEEDDGDFSPDTEE